MKRENIARRLYMVSRSLLILVIFSGSINAQDWANLKRFAEANAGLISGKEVPGRVVFMGNSITESWPKFHPEFFSRNAYVPRGISGQTTPQMLIRFRPDVIELEPEIVVLLAGTNDIAGNTGPISLEEILGNMISMCELARSNGIKVVLASVLPANKYPWKPELKPAGEIIELNKMLELYAINNGIIYLDYYSEMVDDHKGLLERYTYDGVHPNKAGYDIMESLVEKAITKARQQP